MTCTHDIVERDVAVTADGYCPLCMADDNARLRALLGKLRWKSIDKDNMEFRCETTCYVMDEIRRALEPKP